MMWHDWTSGGGVLWGSGMIVLGLLAVLLIAAFVWMAIRHRTLARIEWGPTTRVEGPLEVLKRRLASGQITSGEYEEKRRLLS